MKKKLAFMKLFGLSKEKLQRVLEVDALKVLHGRNCAGQHEAN